MENPQTPPPAKTKFETIQARSEEFANFARSCGGTDEQKTALESLAREYALTGKSEEELLTAINEKRSTWTTEVPPAAPMLNEAEAKRYSLTRAILADASGRRGGDDLKFNGKPVDSNCFEMEVSQQLQRDLKLSSNRGGFFLPTGQHLGRNVVGGDRRAEFQRWMQEMIQRSGLDTQTATAGQELIFTEAGSFIELLRSKAMVVALGATVLPGLRGNVSFPKQTGPGATHWVGENPGEDVQDDDLTLGGVLLSPKTLMSSTSYSRQLLNQGSANIDNVVQNDLIRINALEVDRAAIHGTGTNNEPTGIYAQSGVNSVAMGGAITFDKIVDMETEIAADNADIGAMAYLTTPNVRGKAKKTAELSNTLALALWRENELNGYRAEASNQVSKTMNGSAPTGGSAHGIVFGVWSELLIGEWGAMEIITDPYRLKKQGMIEVTSFLMVDMGLRHAEAFSKGTGLTV